MPEIVHAQVIIVADKEPMPEYLGMEAKKETIVTHSKVINSWIGPFNHLQESALRILDILIAMAEAMAVVPVGIHGKPRVDT
jgi:hypothetical protein